MTALQDGRDEMVAFWLSVGGLAQEEVSEWRRLHGEGGGVGQGGEGYQREQRSEGVAGRDNGEGGGGEPMN